MKASGPTQSLPIIDTWYEAGPARTAASLSAFLSDAFGEALRIEPDLDRIPGLAAERDALWERIGRAVVLTDAEKQDAVGY